MSGTATHPLARTEAAIPASGRGRGADPAPGRRRWAVLLVVAGLSVGAAAVYSVYARDLQTTRSRLVAGSRVVQTSHGPVEYASLGEGPPVLVLHGAAGGYDHGLFIARAYGGEGLRWISPSRFGYLRSPLPTDASTAAQADALAELLDALGVDRIAILGMSGGVPPALQFALRHPGRTSALALLSSAPYAPLTAAEQQLPVPIWVYQALFSSDFPYWLLQRVAPTSLDAVFDVTPALRAALTADEAAAVDGLVAAFQPVTGRVAGLNNEGAAVDPRARYPLAEIGVPTLVVHARDDGINPFRFGEYTAQHIPGARFVPLESGGHLLLGHWPEIRLTTSAFLRRHGGAAGTGAASAAPDDAARPPHPAKED
jgi:2-hydroxy-6-oxonona-2,4-dienedioate hydrolase